MDMQTIDERSGEAPARMKNREAAIRRFGDKAERYAMALSEGDVLADPVAAEILDDRSGKARADFETALRSGVAAVEAPSPLLLALFRQVEAVPAWVDWESIDEGGVAFLSREDAIRPVFAAALAAGYNSAASTKPLVRTGRFVVQAARRANETANWYMKTVRPGGLRRHAEGYVATVRVRLVHAMVRLALNRSKDWDRAAWGAPLNMADTARGVAVEFTIVPVDAARTLGYGLSGEEVDGVIQLFRYVGYLLGVPQALLPANEWDARETGALIELTNDGPDADCRLLIESLLDIGRGQMLAKRRPVSAFLAREIAHGYVRAFAGEAAADRLGLRNSIFKHLPTLTRPIAWLQERRRRRQDAAALLAKACAYADRILADVAATDVVDPVRAAEAA